MQSDPLQQLRGLQLPPEPSWWPPAPGWWLLAALLLAGFCYAVLWLWRRHRSARPKRAALKLLGQLRTQYDQGNITAEQYLHQSNELLKRLLVRGYGRKQYASLAGSQWLAALDEIDQGSAFTSGPGRALGHNRFRPHPDVDVPDLHRCIEQLISRVPA